MKKQLILITSILTLAACNQQANKNEPNSLQNEKDSLQTLLNERDSTLSAYMQSFLDIEQTLDSINTRQNNIYFRTEGEPEVSFTIVDEINKEIKAINQLVEKNSKKITLLNNEIKKSGGNNKKMEEMITQLNQQIKSKQDELAFLNSKLNSMNIRSFQLQTTISLLNAQNEAQTAIIEKNKEALHRAYYIVGTSKDLQKEKIIDKKGGLLGMGRTQELSNDFDGKKFIKVDYSQLNNIPVNCKKVQIITTHPSDSYRMVRENGLVKDIIITDADEFWKASKYLVIVKNS